MTKYRFITGALVLLLLLGSKSFTAYSADLVPFSSSYVAYYKGKDVGKASLALKTIEDQRFQLDYHSSVSKFFLSDRRYETSIFKVEDNKLVPITYEYRREGFGSNKRINVQFDQQTDQILIDDFPQYEWQNELDNQLFRVDLSKRLAEGVEAFSYDFINTRGEKRSYAFSVMENENVSLPYGDLDAIKVKIDRESNRRVTYAWFSPDLDYSLVRLQQFKDGKEQGEIKLIEYIRE
jgi:hypothetical protein